MDWNLVRAEEAEFDLSEFRQGIRKGGYYDWDVDKYFLPLEDQDAEEQDRQGGEGMISICVLTTAWNRYPERFEALKRMIGSVRTNMDWGECRVSWVTAIQEQGHLLREETEAFLESQDIEYFYTPGKPLLANNLNAGLQYVSHRHAPNLILYLQDDMIMRRPYSIEDDAEMLVENFSNVSMVKYIVSEKHRKAAAKRGPYLWLDPKLDYYYSDCAHLMRWDFHYCTGLFSTATTKDGIDISQCEPEMDRRCRELNALGAISIIGRAEDPGIFERQEGVPSVMTEKHELFEKRRGQE